MREWVARNMRVRPSLVYVCASELGFCTVFRHNISVCDCTVFLLPIFAGIIGVIGYSLVSVATPKNFGSKWTTPRRLNN